MDTGKSRPSIRDLMRPDLRHFAGYTPVVPVERLVAETSASSGVALTPVLSWTPTKTPTAPPPASSRPYLKARPSTPTRTPSSAPCAPPSPSTPDSLPRT